MDTYYYVCSVINLTIDGVGGIDGIDGVDAFVVFGVCCSCFDRRRLL